MLEEGRLADGQGRTGDFRITIIVLTRNLGSEANAELTESADVEDARPQVMHAARDRFRPEFLNRLDEILSAAFTPGHGGDSHLPSRALMRDALISYCDPMKVEANTNSYKWERVRICSLDDEYDRDTKPPEINGDRSG